MIKTITRPNRLDRQLRINGWDQDVLENATVGVVGDDDLLASLYIMSASALGINQLITLAPSLNIMFVETANKLNVGFNLTHIDGYYTHPLLNDIFKACDVIVDLSCYGLANKLLLQKGFMENIPIISGSCYEDKNDQGFKIFSYVRGREWEELEQIISPFHFAGIHFDDAVLDIIVAGIVLEETKNILMGQQASEDLIVYRREKPKISDTHPKILVIGSGALGNFVGLGLVYSGLRQITFMDPDVIEETNLNRQIFFYDAVGQSKAKILSERLNTTFGADTNARIEYFNRDTDIGAYDAIFDCVDNFETRIIISELCDKHGKILFSGGSSADGGQIIVYNPAVDQSTPAELLGLYDIVTQRAVDTYQRQRADCIYQPDPSVIMTNQIVAGFMVDSYRMLSNGRKPPNIFYNSTDNTRF